MAISDAARMFSGLLNASHGLSLEQLPGVVREHAAYAGLHHTVIYLTDLQEDVLRLLTGEGLNAGANGEQIELAVDDTPAGQAFMTLEPHRAEGEEKKWWTPLLDGAERVGVLGARVENDEEEGLPILRQLASLITMMIIAVRPHSDSHARLMRTQPMTVAAELQWNLMPPRAFANGQVTISAALEPAYQVGGDAFDYAVAAGVVHLGLFDAMGHDVAAGLTANLAVAACRNARRQNATLIETGEFIEQTLIEQLGSERYVTALLIELDIHTGQLTWVSHGHHSPVVVRGGTWSDLLPSAPAHPLGTDLAIQATLCREQLAPGDRLILYTDGVTEAHNANGEEFGLDRFMNFVMTHNAEGLPVPETLRRLIHSILKYQKGNLRDDATVLFLEWHGPYTSRQATDPPAKLRSRPNSTDDAANGPGIVHGDGQTALQRGAS